ncbi:hypothetical protein ACU4GD_04930 [Cupriavidus basilensis]
MVKVAAESPTPGWPSSRCSPPAAERIAFDGDDFSTFSKAQEKNFRRSVQMVYQDPFGSLNPRMKSARHHR